MKKFLTFVLVLAMVLSVSSFAMAATDGAAMFETGHVVSLSKEGGTTTYYTTLQKAITAAESAAGKYTITFLTDIKESVVVEQNEGVNITIDGAGFKMKNPTEAGRSIEIDGNSRSSATETLKITNIVFDISGLTGGWDAIYQDSAAGDVRYPHNVTIDNCAFNFAKGETGVAVKIRQGYNITISGCEMNGGHSLFQCISCQGATIENTEVYGASEGGVNINNSTGVTVSGCTFECDLYGVRGGAEYDAKGGVTIKGTTIKAEKPIIMRYMTAKADYTLNIEHEGNALTPDWDENTAPTYDEKAPIYVTDGNVTPSAAAAYKKDNLKQDGSIAAWNKDTNTYYTGWRAAIADAKPGETVYRVVNGGLDEAVTIPKPSSGSGISVKYNGGNSFSTSKSDVPTGVEIDNVPVSFTGNGSNFTVSGIPAGAKWITVRWNSTSVTTNFTPNGAYFAEVEIPKTGDMSFWAAIAEFLGF